MELAALSKSRSTESSASNVQQQKYGNNMPIATKIRDRVRNISNKVDSMNINDNHLNTSQLVALDNVDNARLDDDEDRNKNKPTIQDEMLELETDDRDDDMYCEKNDQTQGDTLNQIKALRCKSTAVVPPPGQ